MGQQMTDSGREGTAAGDEEGDTAEANADVEAATEIDFSVSKYTMRTMIGSMVVAKSIRPQDVLAVT